MRKPQSTPRARARETTRSTNSNPKPPAPPAAANTVEKALRRLKKKLDREGTLKEVRNHRHFEKPSERKRRKMKVARFNAMLSARYADL